MFNAGFNSAKHSSTLLRTQNMTGAIQEVLKNANSEKCRMFGAETLQRVAFYPSPSIISVTHELTSGLHDSKTLIKAVSK